ncbi:DUF2252 domain-containing protein [Diaminobutyricibacter sp. McL0608]|uniref:DUF2252 domain-containing protein n=1 Tax=Leifsonia sp. McL0608 TaxID=3143537 RepID=UPI0031F2F9C7
MTPAPGRLRFEHAHVVSFQERFDDGRAARSSIPRGSHAEYTPRSDRDPLGILEKQNSVRLADLIPLRTTRMLANPFAFYRGTAAIQAADLRTGVDTNAEIVICGDAHIANFGLYASPQRTMVFDLNDFDEASYGPWEWDLKRMVTSVVIAARHKGYSAADARASALASTLAYRDSLRAAMQLDALQRFYLAATVTPGVSRFGKKTQKTIDTTLRSAQNRTSARVVEKITELAPDGTRVIVENPPTLTHVDTTHEEELIDAMRHYALTVPSHVALLLSQYEITDVARRVVGVGSVGTRCFILMLTGPRADPLVLQLKEATQSVVQQFGGIPRHALPGVDPKTRGSHSGGRVVSNQRILQAVSDPFLGYLTFGGFDFYVRQFRDRNVSFDIDALGRQPFTDYVASCGALLARAHAQSPNAAFIAGYIGSSESMVNAVVEWAFAYADQSLADFEALRGAVADGRFEAAPSPG